MVPSCQKYELNPSNLGHNCGIPVQVAEVERPLIVVSQLAAAGNDVFLRAEGGSINNIKSDKSIKRLRKGGVYIFRMWVADSNGKEKLVEVVVDSEEKESLAGPGVFPGVVVPSAMSKSGRKYRAANGTRIPNLGQLDVHFRSDERDSVFPRPR